MYQLLGNIHFSGYLRFYNFQKKCVGCFQNHLVNRLSIPEFYVENHPCRNYNNSSSNLTRKLLICIQEKTDSSGWNQWISSIRSGRPQNYNNKCH